MAKCTHCELLLFNDDCKASLIKHFRKSFQCSLALQLEKQTSKVIKRAKLKVELKKIETLEVSKFTSIAVDIDYFDSTLLCDIRKFSLFCEIANFVQQIRQCQHQYRESDLLTLLLELLRDSALIWYKQQQNESEIVKNLSE